MSADLSEVRKRLAAKRTSAVGVIPAEDAIDIQDAPPPDDPPDVVNRTMRPPRKVNRDKKKQAEKLAASIVSSPSGTSPKIDMPLGGPMPASTIEPVPPEPPLPTPAFTSQLTLDEKAVQSATVGFGHLNIKNRDDLVKFVVRDLGTIYVSPPGETVADSIQRINTAAKEAVDLHPKVTDTPSAPPAAPVSTPDSALLVLTKKYTEAGINQGYKGGELQGYVLAKLEDTLEWKNASEAERKSALADSAPKKASPKETLDKIRDWSNHASIMLLGKFALAGLVLFGLGAFFVGILLPWWGQRSLWFLFLPALALVVWAFIKKRNESERSIRTVSIVFAALLFAAGGIFVFTETAVMSAQTESAHGTPVAVTGNLLHACQKVIPGGQFNLSKDLKACALRLSSESKNTALSVPEKQAYRTLATLGGWEDCNQRVVNITTAPGLTDFATCTNARTKQFLGPDVFAAIAKLDQ